MIEQLCSEMRDLEQHVLVLSGPGALSERVSGVARTTTHLGVDRSSLNLLGAVRSYRRALQSIRPDVIHSHLFQSNFLVEVGGHFGGQSIWTIHTSGHGSSDSLKTKSTIQALRALQRRASSVVACSETARTWAEGAGIRIDALVANGVQIPPAPMAAYASNRLLSLARAHPMKDHSTLFEACDRSARFDALICAGSGVERLSVHATLKGRVELLGTVVDVAPLWARVSALILSSAYGEAMPMAGLEALARGVPVITTDTGDCAKLAVEPWMVVPPQDPAALSRAIDRYLALPVRERARLGALARIAAREAYSVDACAQSYRRLYTEDRSR